MSRTDFDVVEPFIGTGNLADYEFDFKIQTLEHLLIEIYDKTDVLVSSVRGDDTAIVDSVDFDEVSGGGTVHFIDDLPTGYQLFLFLAPDEPTQVYQFRGHFDFTLARFEAALDWITGPIQRLMYLIFRTVRLHTLTDPDDFDPTLPLEITEDGSEDRVLALNSDHTGITLGPTSGEIADAEAFALAAQAAQVAAEAAAAAAALSAAAAAAAAGILTGTLDVETFTGDGVTDYVDLLVDPNHKNNTFITFDGVYQPKSSYSLSGLRITFTVAPLDLTAIEVTSMTRATLTPAPSATTLTTTMLGSQTASALSGFLFDGTAYRSVELKYQIRRYSSGGERNQMGTLILLYNTTTGLWVITEIGKLGDAGVFPFDIVAATGQVLYDSDADVGVPSVFRIDAVVTAQAV